MSAARTATLQLNGTRFRIEERSIRYAGCTNSGSMHHVMARPTLSRGLSLIAQRMLRCSLAEVNEVARAQVQAPGVLAGETRC